MTKTLDHSDKKSIFTPYRQKIDDLDQQIMALIGERFNVVRQVGHIKIQHDLKLFQKARVDEVLNNIEKLALNHNLSPDRMRHIYTQFIDYAHEIEGHMKEDEIVD